MALDGICDCHMHVFGRRTGIRAAPTAATRPPRKAWRITSRSPPGWGSNGSSSFSRARTGPDASTTFTQAAPFARELVAANAEHLVWGSDWPHLGDHAASKAGPAPPARYRTVSEEGLLTALEGPAGNSTTLRRILVDNPARLYRF